MIDGNTLIAWGFKPGRWFKEALSEANAMRDSGISDNLIFERLQMMQPIETLMRTNSLPFSMLIDAENDLERANVEAVSQHMDALMRVPTIKAGAVMPDACPSGAAIGTIPVGGVVACEDAIHPGFHSADICCSVAISVFKRNDDPKRILDAAQRVTHFGPGGRLGGAFIRMASHTLLDGMSKMPGNPFLAGLGDYAVRHFATQGDGNHFAYVGHLKSTGQPALVTHHGSRGFGAQVYKRGMAVAKKHTAIHAPKVPSHNAWIKASSHDGESYWAALQLLREWTKNNHFAIHDMVKQEIGNAVEDRFWNEHNFVFRKDDGLFYHGKGATPNWSGFSADDDGRTIVPLNMAEPILILEHTNNKDALGFAPHGAGRNIGRKAFLRENQPELPKGIDARFYCGKPDLSELPEAYKSAASVRAQISKYGIGMVVDEIVPYGSIMAGDWEVDAPWRKK
ncbi:RtcB family protein [Bradyrhizobium sp. SZCCHNRI2010]|uniref:RtcB family protein n=1 Tax=Bradyrhizobium sp. SZCCHNRI2010 TaxID=3057283 RepID=UPI0028E79317|nr:RtcB family protein [Bradyrhizobium sp. SZCCHNRI2010]